MKIIKKLQKIKLALELANEVKELRFAQMQYSMLIGVVPTQIGLFYKKDMIQQDIKVKVKIIDSILEQINKLEK